MRISTATTSTHPACLQGDNDDAEEWQQWPEDDAEISSSDEGKEASDSGDSLYEQAGVGPRTRAQRRTRRKGKRQRASPDRGQEHDRKRRRLRRAALLSSDVDHDMDDLEQVEHLLTCTAPCTASSGCSSAKQGF